MDITEIWTEMEEDLFSIADDNGLKDNSRFSTELDVAREQLQNNVPVQVILARARIQLDELLWLYGRKKIRRFYSHCAFTDGSVREIYTQKIHKCVDEMADAVYDAQKTIEKRGGDLQRVETRSARYALEKLAKKSLSLPEIAEMTAIPEAHLFRIANGRDDTIAIHDLRALCSGIPITIERLKEEMLRKRWTPRDC